LTQDINELVKEDGEEFNQWFAHYLSMKNVTVEQDFNSPEIPALFLLNQVFN